MDGDQAAATTELSLNPGSHWAIAGTGDFDGDGKSDILWHGGTTRSPSGGWTATWSSPPRNCRSIRVPIGRSPAPATSTATASRTSSGTGANNEVAIWRMDGDVVVSTTDLTANAGDHWTIADTGDYNGDGKADILWRGADGEIAGWAMDGDQILGTAIGTANAGDHWMIAA